VESCRLPPQYAPFHEAKMAELWLIEGLPGTGKTTAAERLNALCNARGLPARWWLEEAKNHPVLPASLRKLSASPAFASLCIQAIRKFIDAEPGILILEGSAFQNTVRFMFANEWPPIRISAYVAAWAEAMAPARPRLMMFKIDDPNTHYLDFLAEKRGALWMNKLIAYVESTPVARSCGWKGVDGFVRFWTAYQKLCLDYEMMLPWPVCVASGWSEAKAFDEEVALHFFCS